MPQVTRSKMTLNLDILATEDLGEGVGRTRLTHPRLDGELYFVHSVKGDMKDEFLKALDDSPISAVFEMVTVIKEVANEASKFKSASANPSTGLSASTKNKQ